MLLGRFLFVLPFVYGCLRIGTTHRFPPRSIRPFLTAFLERPISCDTGWRLGQFNFPPAGVFGYPIHHQAQMVWPPVLASPPHHIVKNTIRGYSHRLKIFVKLAWNPVNFISNLRWKRPSTEGISRGKVISSIPLWAGCFAQLLEVGPTRSALATRVLDFVQH